MLLTKSQAQRWANALRSGKYKQTKMTLQDSNGYCCLGVACSIFIPKAKQDKSMHGIDLVLSGKLPSNQPNAPEWLKRINSIMTSKLGIGFVCLNDSYYNFDEIADIIELIYVHEAL